MNVTRGRKDGVGVGVRVGVVGASDQLPRFLAHTKFRQEMLRLVCVVFSGDISTH